MYPLNVSLPAPAVGFAVANDEAEHECLTAAGYAPVFVKAVEVEPADEVTEIKAKLDELGITYHHKAGLDKLKALLPA